MSTHSSKELILFQWNLRTLFLYVKLWTTIKKSTNEKCLLGDVFVLTYGSMHGSYLWLFYLLIKNGVQNLMPFFCSYFRA